ncbi:hypothetical protein J437_LFUL011228 [Ladona fulva]|uniref:60S ribosomal export protein NMD3 n=1 Tax=Ladona fulva TaxID=123851 RepID=A0A8K0KD89_LADFU|nr:hypothetical protein J437_LFUL011228 [Ladona fulva]
MEYMSDVNPESTNKILCCQCGVLIEPNAANMCVACLRGIVDITEGIPKQATLYFCKGCERYLQPPSEWVRCSLESRELLALCLKKLKGLNKVKLVDAGFVWTEPHSRRIKVKLTVHGEVLGGAILQQVFIVEFTVNHQMCDDCHRVEAKDFWKALVQVRQKAENRKTFFYLEQLILKHRAHEHTLGIKPIHDGLDFFFATEGMARKMVDFLVAVLPCRFQHSKKLISHDIHSNIYNYKFTYSVEIVPVSKDSLVCLEKSLVNHLAGIGPLCLVYRVTSTLHLIDPSSGQIAEVSGNVYWRQPFQSICDPKQLTQYIVMDIEPIKEADRSYFPGQGPISLKHVVADAWVTKASELGASDGNVIHTRTHLGHILHPGDTVLGYALAESNINNDQFEKLESNGKTPDVVLVKKFYGEKGVRSRKRQWKLKHLSEDATYNNTNHNDYQEFLEDLEEDPAYRQNINIYRSKVKKPVIAVDTNDIDENEEIPQITLEEMLDDLELDTNDEMEEID